MKPVILQTKRKNPGHYVPGMISGGMLYVSGQIPVNPDTGELACGLCEQTKQALANVEAVLTAAGCTKEQVVQCRVYVSDVTYWDEVNQVYAEFFGAHKPARVIVPTRELHHGALVEIEAMAELSGE